MKHHICFQNELLTVCNQYAVTDSSYIKRPLGGDNSRRCQERAEGLKLCTFDAKEKKFPSKKQTAN